MDRMSMTREELVHAVQRALATSASADGAMTTMELAAALGKPRTWVLRAISRLITDGTVEAIWVHRIDHWGSPHRSQAIRFVIGKDGEAIPMG